MNFYIHANPAEEPTSLCKLMGKYGSDKGNLPDNARHNYTRLYDTIFGPARDDVTRVFELGIFQGASLRGWRDYFPKAIVYGADIEPGSVNAVETEERIESFLCDSTDAEAVAKMWSEIGGEFDVMIDDGPHTYESNRAFFGNSHHMLRSSGVWIVEDLREQDLSFFRSWSEQMRAQGWKVHLHEMLRVVNGEDIPDNNVLALVKP